MAPALKGVVLAAGLGTRLRPLTDYLPKPLIPFLGSTPLELALWRFKAAGIEETAINSHHLHAQVGAFAAKNPFKQKLHVSHEPEILGTGGVYNPLREWQGDSDLLVINGDVITDCNLPDIVRRHQESGAVATMLVLPSVIAGQNAVHFAGGAVRAIQKEPVPDAQPGNFACVQVLSRQFVELLPKEGFFDVISRGYHVALAQGLKVASLVHEGVWHDLGNPQAYWGALNQFLASPEIRESSGLTSCLVYNARAPRFVQTPGAVGMPSYISESARVNGVAIGPRSIIEDRVTLGRGVKISDALVLPGTTIEDCEELAKVIVGPKLRMPL